MIIGQDDYHAVSLMSSSFERTLFHCDRVHLPIGLVLSGALQPANDSNFSCFKCLDEYIFFN